MIETCLRQSGGWPLALSGSILIVAAGFAHGGLKPILWLAAIGIGFFGPLLRGISGWRVQPAHFVERHGLIVIIAIGESLVAIGLGERSSGLSARVIVAAVLGFVVATSFWLAYFDFFPNRARQLLAVRSGAARTALARDVYTYLHLPMVAGIVLFAFAMKMTLAHVGDELDTSRRSVSAVGRRCTSSRMWGFGSDHAQTRSRPSHRRSGVCAVVAGCRRRACARCAHAGGDRLGRSARVRDHLVARRPRRARALRDPLSAS